MEALEEALSRNEQTEVFNTDQSSQFTKEAFTGRLEGIMVGMDGKGRWHDTETKWMLLADDQGLPLRIWLESASPVEVKLAEARLREIRVTAPRDNRRESDTRNPRRGTAPIHCASD